MWPTDSIVYQIRLEMASKRDTSVDNILVLRYATYFYPDSQPAKYYFAIHHGRLLLITGLSSENELVALMNLAFQVGAYATE